MRAMVLEESRYVLRDVVIPEPQAGEVLIKVAYAGINRADLFQKQGRYPLPEHEPRIPGLEISGEVVACGAGVAGFSVGDNVCALLSEGAFAEYACVPAELVLPVPQGVTLPEAAVLPEALATAWVSLVWQAKLAKGERVLIHGGASGVGHIAIQVARQLGATVFATAGTEEKCNACAALGAVAIHHRNEVFEDVVKMHTQGRGVDVILDMVGGDYFTRNLSCLAQNGRLCLIAFLQGARVTAHLSPILLKHLSVMGSTLRARSLVEKAAIMTELHARLWPVMGQENGIMPMIYRIFLLDEAEKALAEMEQGLNLGKILLKM